MNFLNFDNKAKVHFI